MVSSQPEHGLGVLIIHPDAERAAKFGALLAQSEVNWETRDSLAAIRPESSCRSWDAIVICSCLFTTGQGALSSEIRSWLPERTLLVGLIDTRTVDSPALFGVGVDLLLYEPIALADIERMIAFSHALRNESRVQARDRLRKMTALHDLAIAAGHRTGVEGWLDRLVDAGRQILGPDAMGMWSFDQASKRFRCIGSSCLSDEYIAEAEERSSSVAYVYDDSPRTFPTHRPHANEARGRFRIVAPEAAQAAGIKQIAWLPVRDATRFYGHLSFYFRTDESHRMYDLVLADAFSSIVAAALGTFWLQAEIRRTNRLYREHVQSSPDGMVVCLPDGTVERTNPAVEEITGRDQYEIIGQSIFDLFLSPDEIPWHEWQKMPSDDPARPIELWLSRKTGERRRVSCYARNLTFPDPRRLEETEHRIQVVISDITVSARRLVELELFHDLSRLISDRGSLEEAYDLVVSRLYNYLGYRLVAIGEVVEQTRLERHAYRTHMEDSFIPTVMEITTGLCGRAVRENTSLLVKNVREHPEYHSIDDEVLSELVAVIRVNGQPAGIIDIQTDETQPLDEDDLQLAESIAAHLGLFIEQITVQEQLKQQAMTDPLTGIANRRAFIEHLNRLVNDPESNPAALLLVELDHFKGVNDRFGHLFGDEMLKQIAGRLKTVLRENDLLARYGGDEIAMILHDLTPDQAMNIAERLRREVSEEPFSYASSTVHLTVSIGVALFPYHGRSTDELIGEADRAMYAAKLHGRNSVNGEVPVVE